MATICLSGPPCALTGNVSSITPHVAFQLSFDQPADQATVLAYDWYLDGEVIIDQNQPAFSGNLPCGSHTIGVRLLTNAGWTGIRSLAFQACRPATSTVISGPDSLDEFSTATYTVIATFDDSTTLDVTAEYTLSSADGSFTGNVFTPGANSTLAASRQATLTASKTGFADVTKTVTITDSTVVDDDTPGILVVDLYSDTALNVIGLIDNAEVTNNHIAAYTGSNIVPAAATPANALILASDVITQPTLNWRFEFNIAQLIAGYPSSTSFVFYIKGRSSAAETLTGAFILKTHSSQLVLGGSPGSYLPSVNGSDIGTAVNFSSNVVAGANGSHLESDLTTIIRLVYDVASKTISYTTNQGVLTADAYYNMTIVSILNGTGTGVPAVFNGCNLASGQTLQNPYTTLTAGTYQMVLDGTPAVPSHTYATMTVNGINVGSPQLISGGGSYTFTLGTAVNGPDAVFFGIITQ